MEVLELVQSAAFKAGIIPSFNPDELPEDVLNAGKNALVNEILPGLNCDRTLDITTTCRAYTPVGGRIELRPQPQPTENNKIVGYSKYTLAELTADTTKFFAEVNRLDPTFVLGNWPTDDFGQPISAAMWSSDIKMIRGAETGIGEIVIPMPNINIDFPPMRVDAVIEDGSLIPYEYLYREEFERTFRTGLPGVYTTEEYNDRIVVLLNGSDRPKKLILPVPLQIINRSHDDAGTINAPEKFRRYLIDAIAVALAITYGVATVQQMQQQMAQSYQLLKKNKPQPLHKANVSEMICDKLRRDVYTRGRV